MDMSELAPDHGTLINPDTTVLTYVAEGKEEDKKVTDTDEEKDEKVDEVKDDEKKDTGTPV